MLKVEMVSYGDLTEEEQEHQPNNGNGKEYATYIKLIHDGDTLMILSDAVEPEDATFGRDFFDVVTAIELAYTTGKVDGRGERV